MDYLSNITHYLFSKYPLSDGESEALLRAGPIVGGFFEEFVKSSFPSFPEISGVNYDFDLFIRDQKQLKSLIRCSYFIHSDAINNYLKLITSNVPLFKLVDYYNEFSEALSDFDNRSFFSDIIKQRYVELINLNDLSDELLTNDLIEWRNNLFNYDKALRQIQSLKSSEPSINDSIYYFLIKSVINELPNESRIIINEFLDFKREQVKKVICDYASQIKLMDINDKIIEFLNAFPILQELLSIENIIV